MKETELKKIKLLFFYLHHCFIIFSANSYELSIYYKRSNLLNNYMLSSFILYNEENIKRYVEINKTNFLINPEHTKKLPEVIIVDQNVKNNNSSNFIYVNTIEQALSKIKKLSETIIYLRSGTYNLSKSIMIGHSINNIIITSFPGEVAILHGPENSPTIILQETEGIIINNIVFNGLTSNNIIIDRTNKSEIIGNKFIDGDTPILLQRSDSNIIANNTILNSLSSGIEIKDGSNRNFVKNNIIDSSYAPETQGGGIFLHGANYNRISRNFVQNTSGFGIGILNWDISTINIGNIIEYNRIESTAQGAEDSGAVYMLGRSGIDTQAIIAGNIIDGVGSSPHHSVGIYLDDSTSSATVIRNLVRNIGSDAIQIHGGSNNIIDNNIIDLNLSKATALLFQKAPDDTYPLGNQTGNQVTHNIIYSQNLYSNIFVFIDGGIPFINANMYAMSKKMDELYYCDLNPHFIQISKDESYIEIQEKAKNITGFKDVYLNQAGPTDINSKK